MTNRIDYTNYQSNGYFPHERLDVYRVALEFVAWCAKTGPKIKRAKLRHQLDDAADSVVQNICEGASRKGGSRRNHYEIAAGSAGECHGTVNILRVRGLKDANEGLLLLHRIRAMLANLS